MSEDRDCARLIQVIVTTLLRRGTGKHENSPVRAVTQYWSLEGKLLAEVDPCAADFHRYRMLDRGRVQVKWRERTLGHEAFYPAGVDPNALAGGAWEKLSDPLDMLP